MAAEFMDHPRPAGPPVVCTAEQPCENCQKEIATSQGWIQQVLADRTAEDRYRVALTRIAGLPAFSSTDTAIRIAREALQ